ncbi:MAG: hypothetical protein NVSMB17_00680 [Candidatus Dormibacteria bacterium]
MSKGVAIAALLSLLSAALGSLQALPARASDPTASPGHAATVNFDRLGPGVNPQPGVVDVACPPPPLCSERVINVDLGVAPSALLAFYRDHDVTLHVHYEFAAATANPGGQDDMDIYAFDPQGVETGPGSPDTATDPIEDIRISQPVPGAWRLRSVVATTPVATDSRVTLALEVKPVPSLQTRPLEPAAVRFGSYSSPIQTTANSGRPNAGEPSVGSDWATGATMYMAGTQVSRLTWDDGQSPPAATWTDVTPPQLSVHSEDSILFTDSHTNRTWAETFAVACDVQAYTDDDGANWSPSAVPCALPAGPDHPTIGAGPFHPPVSGSFPSAVYYCSQNLVQSLGAFCGHSTNGGVTYDSPSTPLFDGGSNCAALHGHLRVAPDGTALVPNASCGDGTVLRQGVAVSRDNGATFTYSVVADSLAHPGLGSDPSVAVARDGTEYFAYLQGGTNQPRVAVSRNGGSSWLPSTEPAAGLGLRSTVFPEVIAGDGDRAAVAWLGTSAAGDTQAAAFKGAWDLFVSYTYDRGLTWHTQLAVPGHPVQKGCLWTGGGLNNCRNLLDFNDITADRQGRVLVAYTDGCTQACQQSPVPNSASCQAAQTSPPDSTPGCTYGRRAALARQFCGPGLFAAFPPVPCTATPGPRAPTMATVHPQGGAGLPLTAPLRSPRLGLAIGSLVGVATALALRSRRQRGRRWFPPAPRRGGG